METVRQGYGEAELGGVEKWLCHYFILGPSILVIIVAFMDGCGKVDLFRKSRK